MIKRGKEVYRVFLKQKRLQSEFQKQFRLLVTITLGFTIAFTWRQTVFDISLNFVQFITRVQNSAAASVLASVLITIVSIVLIYLSAYFLRNDMENC